MILYTKDASDNLILEILSMLGAQDTITSDYAEYIHIDDHLVILKLDTYSKGILLSVLEAPRFKSVTKIDSIPGIDIFTQVIIHERKLCLKSLVGDIDVHYSDSGLILPDGSVLLGEDVCFSALMGKLPKGTDINKVVNAYYATIRE